jgi:NADPH:quinone reductase-like Zn-dependent oxidoreductase
MRAAYASKIDPDNPLQALTVGDLPEPSPPDGWVPVEVRASSLNHHDLWSLRGVGLPGDRLPMVLGCDAAGVDPDGNEVVVYPVVPDSADPRGLSLLSEHFPGTLAERVAAPRENLIPKPEGLSFLDAACLPTAWLTAYRMLFVKAGIRPGDTVLVQGAGGGVASAAIVLARHGGLRVWVTSRDEAKRSKALELGAHEVFESGARLPERVDAVLETVGEATWRHSLRALRQGGTIVVSGATSGADPSADLRRVFFLQLRVVGSTMGTRDELERLARLCATSGLRPEIDRVLPLAEARDGFAAMATGDVFGKIVFRP